jgi:Protein of unknown function (DUF1488)
MPLTPTGAPGHYDYVTANIYFWMEDGGDERVRCGVTAPALARLDRDVMSSEAGRLAVFDAHRTTIEAIASKKYDGKKFIDVYKTVLVHGADIPD